MNELNQIKCWLLGIWYTLRYIDESLLKGQTLYGHDFQLTGKFDINWELKCERCGLLAESEIND